ncbi:MAG: VanZ family protein [Gemmatimonadetes bacterium]|nr:VanZ family protein [Gemmatimonadota bacterium]
MLADAPLPSHAAPRRSLGAPFRFRRAADLTALRLGRVVLGYLALVTMVITLAPFRFATHPVHGLSTAWSVSDLVMNVVMFVPFGFVHQLTRPRGAPAGWMRVALLGLGLSGIIEVAQLFAPTRFPSLLDLATNTAGALVGAWLFRRLTQVMDGDARRAHTGTAARFDVLAPGALALELPLMGLVYLLIPLGWLIGLASGGVTADGDAKRLLLLPIGMMAGAVLGSVSAAYVPPGPTRTLRWLVLLPLGWVLVTVVPAARGDWLLVAGTLAVTCAAAVLRHLRTTHALRAARRRFERPTLQAVLPLFAAYLTLSALWPLTGDVQAWHGALGLVPAGVPLSDTLVFATLEQLAAFALVGYAGAEFHGRDDRRVGRWAWRPLAWSVAVALLLQGARGFHALHGASALLLVLSQVAAGFGLLVYVRQRAHVQALVRRRARLADVAAREGERMLEQAA